VHSIALACKGTHLRGFFIVQSNYRGPDKTVECFQDIGENEYIHIDMRVHI